MDNVRIDRQRLWDSLMEMAKIGATEKGGVCRLALTDLDRQSRDLFIDWCKAAGCSIHVDAVGNIFARRPGKNPDRAPIATGSHLDSQPTGGRFDGVYGVLAGLEVIRSMNDLGIETEAPVEVVVWTNEEGSRFAPAMMGSGTFTGVWPLEETLARKDEAGVTFGEALKQIGYEGEGLGDRPMGAYFEAHIEQGPILEAEAKTIGVVTGGQGQRWYEVTWTGQEAHAGPTPMASRKDALLAASKLVQAVNDIGFDNQPGACATVGMMKVMPNSRNVIPGQVWMTVDLRHPDGAVLDKMCETFQAKTKRIAESGGYEVQVEEIWYSPPTAFEPTLVSSVRKGAEVFDLPYRDMVSGAGHDAIYLAKKVPSAMVFVPCEDGISHNEIENATPDDLAAGCNVLLYAMLEQAEVVATPGT